MSNPQEIGRNEQEETDEVSDQVEDQCRPRSIILYIQFINEKLLRVFKSNYIVRDTLQLFTLLLPIPVLCLLYFLDLRYPFWLRFLSGVSALLIPYLFITWQLIGGPRAIKTLNGFVELLRNNIFQDTKRLGVIVCCLSIALFFEVLFLSQDEFQNVVVRLR
ncbi:hypothetical protein Enr10x_55790 [Gimesia panareensis]|uniref:Uncharacterized protein n=1 Tax=Gimesia panareensis TaxID=2527978 RepID=A0A517QEZ9_9PLAN|nr:hypothetical protein [Gimesia panareensis]QDT30219.1 hypothetical protein Enr10x_55790 [Gimesia panareensis]